MPTGLPAGSAYVDIRVDMSKFRTDLTNGVKGPLAGAERSANKVMGGVAAAATRAAKFGALGAGAAAIGAIGIIGKMGMEYQNSLNIFQAATSATAAQMDKVKVAARGLGNDISLPGVSAKDAAAAMTELAKGGLSVEQSMRAAKGTLQLATAAQIDGAQAAEIQANSLSMFGLGADKASHVADVLANTANAASGEITDFAGAMKYIGPLAKSMSISIDSASTALGVLANSGIKGEQAGTTLRGMLASLASPSKAAAGAMKSLGVQAFDSHGKFVGLRTVIDQLSRAQKNQTKQQFNANVANAFGLNAMTGVIAMTSQGPAAFDAMSTAVSKEGGAAQLAAAKSKGLGGAIDSMKSTLETAGLALYDKVAPGIESAVRGMTEVLPGALDKVGSFALGVVDGLTSIGDSSAVAAVTTVVTDIGDSFVAGFAKIDTSGALGNIVDSIQRIADVLSGPLKTGWDTVTPLLSDAATVIGVTLAAALDGVKLAMDSVADAAEFVDRNWSTIKTTATALGTTLSVVFLPQLVAAAAQLLATGTAAVVSAGQTAILWTMYKVEAVGSIGAAVAAQFTLLLSFVRNGAAAVASAAQTAVLWTMYKVESVKAAAAAVASGARIAASWVAKGAAATASGAKTAAAFLVEKTGSAAAFAADAARVAVAWAAKGTAATVSAAKTAAAFLVEKVQSAAALVAFLASNVAIVAAWGARGVAAVASAVAYGVANAATIAMTAAQWALNAAFLANPLTWIVIAIIALVAAVILAYKNSETFRNIVQGAWAGIKTAVAAVLAWFTDVLWPGIKAVWDGIVAALKMVWTFASGFVKAYIGIYVWLFNRLVQVVTAIKNGVVAAFRWIWTVVVPAVSNGVRTIIGFFVGLWNRYVTIVGQIKAAIVGGFTAMWNAVVTNVGGAIRRVVTAVGGIKTKVLGVFAGAASWLTSVGKDIISGIVSGLDSAKDWIRRKIEELKRLIPDWAQKAMGIKSPSKVMLYTGRMIGAGLAAGIDQSAPLVEGAVTDLAAIAAGATIGPIRPPTVGRARGAGAHLGVGPVPGLHAAAGRYEPAAAVTITVNGALDPNAVGKQLVELLRRENRLRAVPVIAGG
jgi:TP901 family phage tail tape measure protein